MKSVTANAESIKGDIKVKSSSLKSTAELVLGAAGFKPSKNHAMPIAAVVDGVPVMGPGEGVFYVKSNYGAAFSEKDLAVIANTLGVRVAPASTKQADREKVAIIGPQALLGAAKRILKIVHNSKSNRLTPLGAVADSELGQTLIILTAGGNLYALDYSSKMGLYLLDYTLWVEKGIVKRLARIAVLAKLAADAQGKPAAAIAVYDANDGQRAPKMIETEFSDEGMGDTRPAVDVGLSDVAGLKL